MDSNLKNSLLLSAYILSTGLLFYNYRNSYETITFNEIPNYRETIQQLDIYPNNSVVITPNDKSKPFIHTNIPSYEVLDRKLEKWELDKVNINIHTPGFSDYLTSVLPYILLLLGFYYLTQRPFSQNSLFKINIQDSLARQGKVSTTFKDIIGQKHATNTTKEYVDILKNREKYQKIGANLPKGVLLSGPPGTGKTLLAKAIAGETNLPFISLSGSDLTSMFVGAASHKVRELYREAGDLADKEGGCVVFIDEIDSIGTKRNTGLNLGNSSERENTLNQLLTQLDGFDYNKNILTFAATNRPEILDEALTRSGRFDRKIQLSLPHTDERSLLFDYYLNQIAFHDDDHEKLLKLVSKLTPGLSAADISIICNEAAIIGARRDQEKVTKQDVLTAIDDITLGCVRDLELDDPTKEIIAYHEAGHALVSYLSSYIGDPIEVSIIPREKCLGFSKSIENLQLISSKKKIEANIMVLMAGRISESLFCQDITIGAESDIKKATELAHNLVKKWGMSDDMFQEYNDNLIETKFADLTHYGLDKKIDLLVKQLYEDTRKLILDNQDKLEKIKNLLIEKNTIYQQDIENIFRQSE